MKKRSKYGGWLPGVLQRLSLVERILLVLMILLFAQFFLVLMGEAKEETQTIDVVMRSAAATIFGYFIGGISGEVASEEKVEAVSKVTLSGKTGEEPQGRIGFASQSETLRDEDAPIQAPDMAPLPSAPRRTQIWIAGAIALASLVLLMVARDVEACHKNLGTDSGLATLAQLRDFISGSIGFLVSTSKKP